MNHCKSIGFAKNLFPKLDEAAKYIVGNLEMREQDVRFIRESLQTVIDGRERIKWTYAFFYSNESKLDMNSFYLLQDWQTKLEHHLNHLHKLLEKTDYDKFLRWTDKESVKENFLEFKKKVEPYNE